MHLLLRALPDHEHTTQLDLHFVAVDAMRLATMSYKALDVHAAGEQDFSRVYEESGIPPALREKRVVVRLESPSGTGFVQCAHVVLDRREGATDDRVPLDGYNDVVWRLRPEDLHGPRDSGRSRDATTGTGGE
ncbi:hypothetical protein ACIRJR_07330 [Streptomyces sp. NPDC102402]|uniref:hypothetical protein n=1 Tax=Streptomyces sp. NPDC102402 TaxID=3366169 RepID=UPI0038104319